MFKIILFCMIPFFLFGIPVVFGAMHTIQIDNKTFLINITESNSINIPPTNLSGIENIMNATNNHEQKWTQDGVLITSGTIVAFFTFGSFLVDRMEGRNYDQQKKVIQVILGFTGGIQTIHLIIIVLIVTGHFDSTFYAEMIGLTIIALWVILAGVHEMFTLNSKEKDEKEQFIINAYNKIETSFDKMREQRRIDREEGE